MADPTVRLDSSAQPPPDSGATSSEQRFGHVRIERRLGMGGMGEVLLGFHEGFKTPVAVKVLPERFAGGDLVERFLREAQVAVRLDHPNIVRVFDVGQEGKRVYMVMEYLEGQDLEEYAKDRGGRLPMGEALRLVAQAAKGLAYAHGDGVIHRDIKPANLFRRAKDERVKILDFGLAHAIDTEHLTSPGVMMGTLPYMSLEQLMGHAAAPSDVYALGISLYRLLTGKLPATGTLEEMLRFHNEGSPAPLSTYRPVPQPVQELVSRMLVRKPEERPSAEAVAHELDRLIAELGERGPSTSSPQAGPAGVALDSSGRARVAEVLLATGTSKGATGPEVEPTFVTPRPPTSAPRPAAGRPSVLWAGAGVLIVALAAWGGWRVWGRDAEVQPTPTRGTPSAGTPRPQPAAPTAAGAAMLIRPEGTRGFLEDATEQQLAVNAERGATPEVRAKEGIRFAIRSEVPAHLYIFNVDTKGEAYCLFPTHFEGLYAKHREADSLLAAMPRNPLAPEKGVVVAPPIVTSTDGRRFQWWYTADESTGEEWFLVAADASPIAELEALRAKPIADLAGRAGELKTLAAKWGAEGAFGGTLAPQLTLSIFPKERSVPLGNGASRAAGRMVWTMEMEHR